MNYYDIAQEMYDDLIAWRRHIHENPETGFDLPKTSAFVKEKLTSFGINPEDIGENGVTAVIGKPGGKVVLLRADMDALPMAEKSGVPFAATNGKMHACGHDIHTTCLLGAAKMLKANEANLNGQIKFIFQPAEELLIGGGAMVEAGILENPKVDVAFGLHCAPNAGKLGFAYAEGTFMTSANNFRITVKGVGSHGSMPYNGVDPVFIGAKIVTGVPEIIARELPFDKSAVCTMGGFHGNGTVNVVPDEVIIEGTVRTFTQSTHEYYRTRLPEIVQDIAKTYRGEAELEFLSNCPPLHNDENAYEAGVSYIHEFAEVNDIFVFGGAEPVHASEDFAYYAKEVPGFFFNLLNPNPDSDTWYPVHHPAVVFDEASIPLGASIMAYIGTRWLEEHGNA